MKHILVPIGSTDNASNTLQYAIEFATKFDAKIFVFRAYNFQTKAGTIINIGSIIERETNLYMRSVVNSIDRKNIEINLISAKGSVLDSIDSINSELEIDLVIVGPKSNSIKEEFFLGRTTGSIIKKTEIPILIIPNGYIYQPIKSILTAFKSGILTKKNTLKPLHEFINIFDASAHLLLVKTPKHTSEDLILDSDLEALKSSLTITESPTTYQGVLGNIKIMNPDLLCVFRRKRGFFKKLWEKNVILKEEFYCDVPLLILREKF